MQSRSPRHQPLAIRGLGAIAFSILVAASVTAQSTEASLPTPLRTNEVVGTIRVRDLGDARVTDHFYAFSGVPGDLIITVEGHNLNGDLDVFTAGDLRPLLKVSLYAESPAPVAKSIYLRKRVDLILRIEGRSPNDEDASYHIQFSGSFVPASGAALIAEAENTNTESKSAPPGDRATEKKIRRVSSVGARIEEPPAPVAAAPAPTPTETSPSPSVVAAAPPEKSAPAKPREVEPPKTAPAKTARRRAPVARKPRKSPPAPTETSKTEGPVEVKEVPAAKDEAKPAPEVEKKAEPAKSPEAETPAAAKPAESSELAPKPKPAPRRGVKRSAKSRPAPKPVSEPAPESGPRLIIETKDGTRVDHFMSSVRRVTVENGQIVVVGNDGKVERLQMANVVRFSIEP